jgi:protein phosphatase
MSITIDCFGMTDRGRVRRLNEDQFLIADLAKSMRVIQSSLPEGDHTRRFGVHHGKLLAVADGMGGVSGGEVASGLAIETVTNYVLNTMPWFFRVQDGREQDLEDELKSALEECQRKVSAAAAESNYRRMGTTLTMAYVLWPRIYVVHAGDSRCYLFRNGRGHRITRDHTVAQQMVERGIMSPEEAESSRWSHALWNCIGGGSNEINPDVYKATLHPGDTVLLCTDGLSKYLSESDIAARLQEHDRAEDVVRSLVDAANAAGGDDNVTVIVAQLLPVVGTNETAVELSALQPAG